MKLNLQASCITHADFKYHLSKYKDLVPAKLQPLENLRLQAVPETLEQRRKAGDAFLEKPEVEGLVDWKLYLLPPWTSILIQSPKHAD